MAKAKKKATGLAKRGSFLDRDVIAENKAILRFNDDLENQARKAQGLPPLRDPGSKPPGSPRAGRRSDPGHRESRAGVPAGQRHQPRPELPPALDAVQEGQLRAAVDAVAAPAGVHAAGARMIDRLVGGDRFTRATELGWETLAAAHAADGAECDWDRLRAAWGEVRAAALAEWVKTHPEAVPVLKAKPAERVKARHRRRSAAQAKESEPGPQQGADVVNQVAPVVAEPGEAPGQAPAEQGVGAPPAARSPHRRRPHHRSRRQPLDAGPVSSTATEQADARQPAPEVAVAAGPDSGAAPPDATS